jgi:hypothetical protein
MAAQRGTYNRETELPSDRYPSVAEFSSELTRAAEWAALVDSPADRFAFRNMQPGKPPLAEVALSSAE